MIQTSHNPALTVRPYEGEQDLIQMMRVLMQGRAQTGDWRYAHVGELLFNFFMVDCHLSPQAFIRLWHSGDILVGYAMIGEDPTIDWQVLPGYTWRCGIEAEALEWAMHLVDELRQGDPQKWGGAMVSGARQDDIARIAFLEQHGFRYNGEFAEVNMLRWLDAPIPEPALPAGCQARGLADEAGEISQRADAQRQVWQPWTVGNVSDEDYARLMRLPGYKRELDVVTVTPEGVIAAYVNGWVDPLNHIGDFGPVGALPAYRRQGLTRAALLESLRRMRARGMERVCVSTGVVNVAARRLYESVGFKVVNRYWDYVQAK
jgi:ribosomal protein S18 acetylase RimI-like enzyme